MVCKRHPKYTGANVPRSKHLSKHDCFCRKIYAIKHWLLGPEELASRLNVSPMTVRNYGKGLPIPKNEGLSPDEQVQSQIVKQIRKQEEKFAKEKDAFLVGQVARLQLELKQALSIKESLSDIEPLVLRPSDRFTRKQGIANVLISDYHLEERVRRSDVEGLNEYNLAISEIRLQELFTTTLRFVELEQRDTEINDLVVWLLGDNITGWLHEESIADCEVEPAVAATLAYQRLVQGIQFLLDNSKLNLILQCVVGNHGRMTKRPHHATENGNSLEYMIYHFIKDRFSKEPRVKISIPDSGFAFVDEFGFVIRGSHGHRIAYKGGVRGMGVPASSRIAQWNKMRPANCDVFGHHHTAQDGENFFANGSIIGMNSFAYKNGFSFKPPEQKFFVIHSRWKRPILSRSIFFTK